MLISSKNYQDLRYFYHTFLIHRDDKYGYSLRTVQNKISPTIITIREPYLKRIITFLLITFITLTSSAVELQLQVEGIVDNREYFGEYADHGTVFGLREAATVKFDNETPHQFRVGAVWLQEFGAPIEEWAIAPLINYRYATDQTQFTFGSFMRNEILHSPLFFDYRYSYIRPQVEGFDYQYHFPNGIQSIWVDWDGRQTSHRNESFYVGISGIVRLSNFSFTHHLLYRHIASRDIPETDPIKENGGAHFIFAYTDTTKEALDTLQFTGEMIGSYNRFNRTEAWNAPLGIKMSSAVIWRKVGIRGSYYREIIGSKDGHQFEQGAPFYNASQFGEIDLLLFPVKSENITMSFDWTVTILPNDVENRQYFKLTGEFGKKFTREQ